VTPWRISRAMASDRRASPRASFDRRRVLVHQPLELEERRPHGRRSGVSSRGRCSRSGGRGSPSSPGPGASPGSAATVSYASWSWRARRSRSRYQALAFEVLLPDAPRPEEGALDAARTRPAAPRRPPPFGRSDLEQREAELLVLEEQRLDDVGVAAIVREQVRGTRSRRGNRRRSLRLRSPSPSRGPRRGGRAGARRGRADRARGTRSGSRAAGAAGPRRGPG
jgi:hypothetical protein